MSAAPLHRADSKSAQRRPPFSDNPTVGVKGAMTYARILDAALDVFREHGFHGATVELVTQAAGCSRPTFYQYFSSKDDLFWNLADGLGRAIGDLAEHVDVTEPSRVGVQSLQAWIDTVIDLHAAYWPIMIDFQAASREHARNTSDLRRIGDSFGAAIINSAGPTRGERLHLAALANLTAGIIFRSTYYWLLGLGRISRTRFVDGLSQTIHRLLHGPIANVNVAPATGQPRSAIPDWPDFPAGGAHDGAPSARTQLTRQRLLLAGRAVLPQKGYRDTRVDDIVEAAAVSHGSFYQHFRNKDQLFQVLAGTAASNMAELVASFPATLDHQGLEHWIRRSLSTYRDDGGIITVWQEISRKNPELARFSVDVALVTFDRLKRIIVRRGFGDSAVDAIVLLSVIERTPHSVQVLQHIEETDAIEAAIVIIQEALFGRRDGCMPTDRELDPEA